MYVLGIETSCDETAVAIFHSKQGLLVHHVYSQTHTHAQYGGVVPELASRDHIRKLIPLIHTCLLEAGNGRKKEIDGIAYTAGPGLIGALLVGATVARSLAWTWKIPSVGIHHMEGHLLAPLMEPDPPVFPFVALLVSGGHTQLVHVEEIGRYTLLGESVDDAAGEAFDKVAKKLGLGYPGGPAVEQIAYHGTVDRFRFPRPMTDRPGCDFSFSGLKTHTFTILNGMLPTEQDKADVAACFQEAVLDTLVIKSYRALKATGIKTLIVAGGVSANTRMRKKLEEMAHENGYRVYFPRLAFCGDNGAMIAFAGHHRLIAGESDGLEIHVRPRWMLQDLRPPCYHYGN